MSFYHIILLLFLMSVVVFVRCDHKCAAKEFTRCTTTTKSSPFDDLSYEEIQKVTSIIKTSREFPSDIQFAVVRTQEPKKVDWLNGKATFQRQAYVALFNVKRNVITEVTIDLRTSRIIKSRDLEKGILPPLQGSEEVKAGEIISNDPRWREALANRSINPDNVALRFWISGPHLSLEESKNASNQRLVRVLPDYLDQLTRFHYNRPISGLVGTVDLNKGKVIEILKT